MATEGFKAIPFIALIIAISGIVIGASVISLSKFGDSIDKCEEPNAWNTSTSRCEATNSSHDVNGSMTAEYAAISNATAGNVDLAEQLPTVAIIGIMVVILSVISGVFVYLRYFS